MKSQKLCKALQYSSHSQPQVYDECWKNIAAIPVPNFPTSTHSQWNIHFRPETAEESPQRILSWPYNFPIRQHAPWPNDLPGGPSHSRFARWLVGARVVSNLRKVVLRGLQSGCYLPSEIHEKSKEVRSKTCSLFCVTFCEESSKARISQRQRSACSLSPFTTVTIHHLFTATTQKQTEELPFCNFSSKLCGFSRFPTFPSMRRQCSTAVRSRHPASPFMCSSQRLQRQRKQWWVHKYRRLIYSSTNATNIHKLWNAERTQLPFTSSEDMYSKCSWYFLTKTLE